MNMPNHYSQDRDLDYQVDDSRSGEKIKSNRKRSMSYSRSSRPAVSHNGIHRRRNKRFSW